MVEPYLDGWSVVLAGRWNISIFSPPWLTEHVFNESELLYEFPVAPGLPQRITGAEIRMVPRPDRVILSPIEPSEEHLVRMETFACNLLRVLQHTPISATGINFGFTYQDDNLDDFIDAHFPSVDENRFTDNELTVKEKTFTRSLGFEDWVLNLKTTVKRESNIRFDFNFHANTANAEISLRTIQGKVLELKNKAETILETIYGIRETSDD